MSILGLIFLLATAGLPRSDVANAGDFDHRESTVRPREGADRPPAGYIQGGPKSRPLPNDQEIVLKPVNEIRFSRKIKVLITHNNIIRWHLIFYV